MVWDSLMPHYCPVWWVSGPSLLVTRDRPGVNRNVRCYAEEQSGPTTCDSEQWSVRRESRDIKGIIGLLLVLISWGHSLRPARVDTVELHILWFSLSSGEFSNTRRGSLILKYSFEIRKLTKLCIYLDRSWWLRVRWLLKICLFQKINCDMSIYDSLNCACSWKSFLFMRTALMMI